METLYFYHSQLIDLRIRVFDTYKLVGRGEILLYIHLSPKLMQDQQLYKFVIPRTDYKAIRLEFPVPIYNKLELPVDCCYRIELYCDKDKIDEISNKDGFILSKDKYFEYFIRENIMHEKLKIPKSDIKYYSGPGKPDIIFRNIDIEATHSIQQLSFTKFSTDVAKFEKYRSKYKLKQLIIVHDSPSVQPAIKEVVKAKKYIWVLDFATFSHCFMKIISGTVINKTILTCKGIARSPLRRKNSRIISEIIDLSDRTRFYKHILHKASFKPELLYIRDIRPHDLIYIIIIAYEYKDQYKEREGFKNILISKRDYLFQHHKWHDVTEIRVIEREFWFRPLIHMGILDGNYKITSIGEYLYQLWMKSDKDEYYKYLKYRFLKGPGIKDFIALLDKLQKQIIHEKIISMKYLNELLLDKLLTQGYLDNREQGIRYIDSIKSWMKYFNFGEFIPKKGFVLNKKEMKSILTEY